MLKRLRRLWLLPIVFLILGVGLGGTASATLMTFNLDVVEPLTDLGPFDITLTNFPASHWIVTKEITNNTGIDWIGYNFALGFPVAVNDHIDFVPSVNSDGLYFTGDKTSDAFTKYALNEDQIYWYDGLVADGDMVYFTLEFIFDSPSAPGSFTFREQPAPIPEPATMFLVGSGLVGLAGFRKRFRKS